MSPFFDGLDRVQLDRFQQLVGEAKEAKPRGDVTPAGAMLDLSTGLGEFLFEHEILDDRERDRDFFVAMRAISRVIEEVPATRRVLVETVAARAERFLEERHMRWQVRVKRLPEGSRPRQAGRILGEKVFVRQMASLRAMGLDRDAERSSEALAALTQMGTRYRGWIEELEAREDEFRASLEKRRQEGLASAQNELKELQERQGQVSRALDRAEQRPLGTLREGWPAARMNENSNVQAGARLESKLAALSPQAAERLKAALGAMTRTLDHGNGDRFVPAESESDLAGRLLRQSQQAASQSQRDRQSRGRRRHVSGDKYYGQTVVGGDVEIKRDYEVDRRYREAILDEVRERDVGAEERVILENYLREVVR
jgi:hypothetical protein